MYLRQICSRVLCYSVTTLDIDQLFRNYARGLIEATQLARTIILLLYSVVNSDEFSQMVRLLIYYKCTKQILLLFAVVHYINKFISDLVRFSEQYQLFKRRFSI